MAWDLVLLALPHFLLIFLFPLVMGFIGLTMICFVVVFANKRPIAPRLSLVNVVDLNKVLRSEVFVSEDRKLRAVHLILDFELISNTFQEMGHAIRASNSKLCRIDVSMPSFLAREDLPPVELPLQHSPHEVALPRKEIASSCLSLETKIDQFYLEDEREKQGE